MNNQTSPCDLYRLMCEVPTCPHYWMKWGGLYFSARAALQALAAVKGRYGWRWRIEHHYPFHPPIP